MLKKTALLLMLLSTSLRAENQVNFVTCNDEQKALGLCQALVKDLDNENQLLKQKIGILVTQRDQAQKELEKASEPRLIPAWGWILIGAAMGAGTYAVIRR